MAVRLPDGQRKKVRSFGLAIPEELVEAVDRAANQSHRSRSGQVEYILARWLDDKKGLGEDEALRISLLDRMEVPEDDTRSSLCDSEGAESTA
jgi:metal-responsive CopG/Arc/MetJ family transcriptional regulator